MIRTVIIPENQDISIHIPSNYIGRELEVTVFPVDELKVPERTNKKKHRILEAN